MQSPVDRLPLELVDEILKRLPIAAHDQLDHPRGTGDTSVHHAVLASCARVSRLFHVSAVRVLWRDQHLGWICRAIFRDFIRRNVSRSDRLEARLAAVGLDDDSEEEGNDTAHGAYSTFPDAQYGYLPRPISAEEWARFEHYAPHVHVLRYTRDETIDSSFFLLLQQYARRQPLFPNLHELIWEHATPELVSVVSPSIRIIRLPEDEENEEYAAEAQVNVFHMRRHVFKALLPTVLKGVPSLEVLKTRTLGRETFWSPLRAPSGECLLSQSIRVLHISESFTTLTRVALVIISSLQRLVELSIKCSGRGPKHNLGMGAALDLSDVRPFNRLERLRIKGFGIEVTALIEAIVAPVLEDVGIGVYTEHHQNQTRAGLALGVALDTLRRRNADTLWRLHLDVRSWPVPFFPTTTEPTFAPIARPLLDLRHLRYVSIFNGGRADVSVPALVAAWPDLRTLIMPAQEPSPDMLTAIAHTCTKLESLSFDSLAKEFLDLPPVAAENPAASTDSDVAIPALRELRLIERLFTRDSPDAKHENITRFLRSLFPRLVVEQKLVGADPVPYTDMSLAWYYEDNL